MECRKWCCMALCSWCQIIYPKDEFRVVLWREVVVVVCEQCNSHIVKCAKCEKLHSPMIDVVGVKIIDDVYYCKDC